MIILKNLPRWERLLRLLAGVCVLAMAAITDIPAIVMIVAGGTGLTLMATSLFGFCPACALVGRRPQNTRAGS